MKLLSPSFFALLFHEVLAISNLLQSIISPKHLDHNETNIRHDISGTTGQVFDENVKKLLDFVKARVNPFRMPKARIPLYNIVSNQTVCATVENRLINCLKNGETVYLQIRKEMFIDKTRKITDTLHRRMLPSFVTENPKEKVQVSYFVNLSVVRCLEMYLYQNQAYFFIQILIVHLITYML